MRDVNFKTCGCVIHQQLSLGVLQPHLLICPWELLVAQDQAWGQWSGLCAARGAVGAWQLSAWCLDSYQVVGHEESSTKLTETWALLQKGWLQSAFISN